MLKAGADLFIQDPRRSDRYLFRGQITSIEANDHHRVQMDSGILPVDGQSELLVYFHRGRDFLQQVMEVVSGESDDLCLRPLGDPISNNKRAQDRVSTLTAGVTASVGGFDDCRVQDISATGFAVLTSGRWHPGQVVEVSLTFEARTWPGRASIQSVREMGPNRMRYGLRVIGVEPATADDLVAAIPRISLEIQRSLLNRRLGPN